MKVRVAAYAVVVRDGEMLLTHWVGRAGSGWTLPGGGIDPGEDPADAAVREVREETGYEAELGELLGIDSIVTTDTDGSPLQSIRIVYRARISAGALAHEVGGSTDEAAWVPLAEIDGLDRVALVDAGRRFAGLLSDAPST